MWITIKNKAFNKYIKISVCVYIYIMCLGWRTLTRTTRLLLHEGFLGPTTTVSPLSHHVRRYDLSVWSVGTLFGSSLTWA